MNSNVDNKNSVSLYPGGSSTRFATNIVSGAVGGALTAIGGTITGLSLVAVSPIQGVVEGFQQQGAVGAIVGGSMSGTLGTLFGVSIVLGSGVSCVSQCFYGLTRTPAAMIALLYGLEWDADLEVYERYSLQVDLQRTFDLSDSIATAIIFEREILKNHIKGEAQHSASVADLEFYNRLGVPPTATSAEIKKAYYSKARECHPDKNIDDQGASARFQSLGEAYLVLSDEQKRFIYDSSGSGGLKHATDQDPSALITLLFGSENIETIVGELWIAPIMQMLSGGEVPLANSATTVKQRRREVQLAVTLLYKLRLFVTGNKEGFTSAMRKEATELAESPLAAALVRLVGTVYLDRANGNKTTLNSLTLSAERSAASLTMCLQIFQELTLFYANVDSSNSTSAKALAKKKKAILHMMTILWLVTRLDIAHTVDSACQKVLHDHSASDAELEQRRLALAELGEIFVAAGGSSEAGMEYFVEKVSFFEQGSAPPGV